MGKHLKKLRAEKAKIQMKKKKKTLPKGQNVTDTSFQVKKIVVLEQLKKADKGVPTTSWNLTLKDLLNHLHHFNVSSRLNGVRGIGELVATYPEMLNGPSLRTIITRLLELVSDIEHGVRKAVINLLDALFSRLNRNQIELFYDILNVHLGCAMTHRDIAIQRDSLLFADIIVEHAPEAIKQNFKTVMKNFIRMFSMYKYGAHAEVFLTKGSKTDLEASRINILKRLYHILNTFYKTSEDAETSTLNEVDSDEKFTYSANLSNKIFQEVPNLQIGFKKKDTDNKEMASVMNDFQLHVSSIMPLLFETWTEFSPVQQNNIFSSECFLSENVAQMMYFILRIVQLLFEYIRSSENPEMESWFITTYNTNFRNSFLSHFPYLHDVSSKRENHSAGDNKSNGESVDSLGYLNQNLTLCYLYYCFRSKSGKRDYESKIERYVTNCVIIRNIDETENLSKIIEMILLTSSEPQKVEAVLSSTVKAYSITANKDLRRKLFDILTKLALDDKCAHLHSNKSFLDWTKSLPSRFLKQKIPARVIEAISKIVARKSGSEALKEVEDKASEIIRNLPSINIKGIDRLRGRKLIANVLFWCRIQVLEEIIKSGILQKESYPSELKNYLVDIVSYKLSNSNHS